jgi:glutaredoxin
MKMKIEIYTKHNCPNCVMAKQLLNANNLDYTELDVSEPDVMLQLIMRYPDVRQMPQIFIDDQRVGGLAGLQAALEQL